VEENKSSFPGVEIHESIIRKYTDSEAFASILGYTGKISTSEYDELKKTDKTITMNDVVGKSGIEQYMDSTLRGTKGSDTLYVDNVGNIIKKVDHVDSKAGNDVYLSIDYDLQVRTYKLLEKEIAGILISKLVNEHSVSATSDTSKMNVAVYDAYIALINNGVIDSEHFSDASATDLEKTVYSAFQQKQAESIQMVNDALLNGTTPFGSLQDEPEAYQNYVIRYLKNQKILKTDSIDTSDSTYKSWAAGKLSIHDYLKYCLEKSWIDTDSIKTSQKYVDTDELYQALVSNICDAFQTDSGFSQLVYRYAILQDRIRPGQVCALLYDQGVLAQDDATRNALASGSMNAYNFILDKLKNLQITPGQLGLDPCSGSCVILDTQTGAVLACVSYPGFDNNRLANTVDSKYYAYLNSNSSRPLYNFATQQKTAPGSTFKPMSSTAGMAEGVITPTSTITDEGVFTKVSNHPGCWIYRQSHSTHGTINVSEALRDSCNYFFYEVGWRLAGGDGNYDDATGISKIQKYADLYGLDEKTGLEIEESKSTIATEYPVMAAIGQSNNNYTTVALARYAAAIANEGTVYNLSLLDHSASPDGTVIKTYGSTVRNKIDVLNSTQWDVIHTGMRMVVQNLSTFKDFPVEVSGKTGTAQESHERPPHALFIAFAPSSSPQYALATRIANGYTSHNAAEVSKDIIGCLFQVPSSIEAADNSGASTASNEASND
jgi:penicillin-binding protein 2